MPRSRLGRARAIGEMGLGIASAFTRGGARGLLETRKLDGAVQAAHENAALRLLEGLGRLRGLPAKLGQLLAQRPGTMPEPYLENLLDLATRVPPMHYSLVKTRVLQEMGQTPAQLFKSFDREPIASASLGQVHRAVLQDGRPAAVKIQYPGIADTLRADIDNLRLLLGPAERFGHVSGLPEVFAELEARMQEELDYRIERENISLYRRLFAGDEAIVIPEPFAQLSSAHMLSMDYLQGRHLTDYLAAEPSAEERGRVATALLRFVFHQEYVNGVLHVDPNPGNYLFLPGGRVGVVDFGCVKRLPQAFHVSVVELTRAGADRRWSDAEVHMEALGLSLADAGTRATHRRLMELWVEPFSTEDFDFGRREYLDEIYACEAALLRAPQLTIPRDWVFVLRNLVGQAFLLHKVAARGDFRRTLRDALDQSPQASQLQR